jgi:hypothetical protein
MVFIYLNQLPYRCEFCCFMFTDLSVTLYNLYNNIILPRLKVSNKLSYLCYKCSNYIILVIFLHYFQVHWEYFIGPRRKKGSRTTDLNNVNFEKHFILKLNKNAAWVVWAVLVILWLSANETKTKKYQSIFFPVLDHQSTETCHETTTGSPFQVRSNLICLHRRFSKSDNPV